MGNAKCGIGCVMQVPAMTRIGVVDVNGLCVGVQAFCCGNLTTWACVAGWCAEQDGDVKGEGSAEGCVVESGDILESQH